MRLHARERGFHEQGGVSADRVTRTRELLEFIRCNGRMPQGEELEQFRIVGDLGGDDPGSARFRERVEFLERLADFIESNGRFPTENDIGPDPF